MSADSLTEAIEAMTEVARAVNAATRDLARVYVELEELRDGLATVDARIAEVARGEYKAAVRQLRDERG